MNVRSGNTDASETKTGDPETGQVTTGIIVVDHGSRREASNQMLLAATQAFGSQSGYSIVEPAHMELAQPDIATAFDRCVRRGAVRVVVFPYFLSPGRHWNQDIPALVAAAAARHPGVSWLVTAPFGLHPGMLTIMNDRIARCLQNSTELTAENHTGCDVCSPESRCRLH